MKRLLLFCTLVLSIVHTRAQTYVSGGIYSNTTWTKAASPYIVTDTVVVFPGVTLTIEPGVTVKFNDSTRLEIREAIINAIGTPLDSITFTSNSISPKPSKWWGIAINIGKESDTMVFNYCNFHYALEGLLCAFSDNVMVIKNCNFTNNDFGFVFTGYKPRAFIDSSNFSFNTTDGLNLSHNDVVFINNCNFSKNKYGIRSTSSGRCILTNCLIDSNNIGIESLKGRIHNCDITNNVKGYSNLYRNTSNFTMTNSRLNNNSEFGTTVDGDSLINCEIKSNGIGVLAYGNLYYCAISHNVIMNNIVGINVMRFSNIKINCNKICSNTSYDLKYEGDYTHNINIQNNFWCTPDSASTRPKIFDGYVDVKYGLVNFMPLDTTCYKALGVEELNNNQQTLIKLYPNPFSHTATLEFENSQSRSCHLSVFNSMGQLVMSIDNIKNNKILIDRKELQSGLYFYQLRNEEAIIGTGKMMLTD